MNHIKYSQDDYIEQRRRKQRHATYKTVAMVLVLAAIAVNAGVWLGGLIIGSFL